MISKTAVIKKLSGLTQLTSGAGGAANASLTHPTRDWIIGLLLGLGLFVACVWYSVVTYNQNQSLTPTDVSQASAPVYRAAYVESALLVYKKRAAAFDVRITDSQSAQPIVPAVASTTVQTSTPTTTPVSLPTIPTQALQL